MTFTRGERIAMTLARRVVALAMSLGQQRRKFVGKTTRALAAPVHSEAVYTRKGIQRDLAST